uniref:Uncharacterized protein n=1 Tax=Chenopodium quinoa TaxID=63459 RepID=A0A803KT58_CHEQI
MSFSRNNLHGIIPASLCSAKNLELLNLEHNHLGGTIPECFTTYELQYILTIFTSIDFSNNAFHGELPEELGNLNALVVLNLAYNSSGHIPSSFGNLSQIESLDLSCNNLSGKIPAQLANLNFLGYLNLSFNKLLGKIPTGTQLQSFNASSYEGNQGLYGPPLTTRDPTMTTPTLKGSNWSSKSEQEWMLMGVEVGCSVGITVFVGPIFYIKRRKDDEEATGKVKEGEEAAGR